MRRTMEDKSVIVQDLAVPALAAAGLGPQTFAAVYDGHGGTQASQYLAENLHQNLKAALLRCADDVAAAHAAARAASRARSRRTTSRRARTRRSASRPRAGSSCTAA